MTDLFLIFAAIVLSCCVPQAVRDLKRGIRAAHLLNVINEETK